MRFAAPSIKLWAFFCVVQNYHLLLVSEHVTGFAVPHVLDTVDPVVMHFALSSARSFELAQMNTLPKVFDAAAQHSPAYVQSAVVLQGSDLTLKTNSAMIAQIERFETFILFLVFKYIMIVAPANY